MVAPSAASHRLALVTVILLASLTAAVASADRRTQSRMESSDAFWASLRFEGVEAEHYVSLQDMSRSAELVVTATIEDVIPSRAVGGKADAEIVRFAVILLNVQAVIRDHSQAIGPLKLEVTVPGGADAIDRLRATMPTEQSLYFLRNKGSEVASWGWPADAVAHERAFYRLVSMQGVIHNNLGTAVAPVGADEEFLIRLTGQAFDDVLRAVEDAR